MEGGKGKPTGSLRCLHCRLVSDEGVFCSAVDAFSGTGASLSEGGAVVDGSALSCSAPSAWAACCSTRAQCSRRIRFLRSLLRHLGFFVFRARDMVVSCWMLVLRY